MERELTPISVQTLPNGYSLTVYDKSYLYFNVNELFNGLCYHACMAMAKEQDKKVISEVVSKLLLGGTSKLMERNQEQQMEIAKLKAKVEKLGNLNVKLEAKVKRLEKKKAAKESPENNGTV